MSLGRLKTPPPIIEPTTSATSGRSVSLPAAGAAGEETPLSEACAVASDMVKAPSWEPARRAAHDPQGLAARRDRRAERRQDTSKPRRPEVSYRMLPRRPSAPPVMGADRSAWAAAAATGPVGRGERQHGGDGLRRRARRDAAPGHALHEGHELEARDLQYAAQLRDRLRRVRRHAGRAPDRPPRLAGAALADCRPRLSPPAASPASIARINLSSSGIPRRRGRRRPSRRSPRGR